MKQARLLDYRRWLVTKEKKWTSRIESFSYVDVSTLGTMDLLIQSPVTILCGPNGVGKSTLLGTVRASMEGTEFNGDESFYRKVIAGTASVILNMGGEIIQNDVVFGQRSVTFNQGRRVPVNFVNTGITIPQLQAEFAEFDARDDLLNGVGSKDITGPDLAAINYILKRDYQSVTLWEVETSSVVPFFEVVHGADHYDSRTMGAGELAALYIWWKVNSAESDSFLFVEEPETFLSTHSQQAIGDFILTHAVDRSICVVMTSHSAPIIAPLPPTSLKFFFRSQGSLKLATRPSLAMLRSIGIDYPVSEILLVEDEAARVFAKLLLEHSDPQIAARMQIEVRNGHGGITSTIDAVGSMKGKVRVVGMYDGDQRAQIAEAIKADEKRRVMCLPGAEPIEVTFRKLVKSSPAAVALLRGVSEAQLEELLHAAEGAEDHDWYQTISQGLGLTREQLLVSLFTLWMRDEASIKAVEEWHSELRSVLSRGRTSYQDWLL